ncbi:hypothetical protein G7046_g6155 [Stylonectria norvegica]|nr:hypothetical protein G7046_g6155 [Stylonectria norvegica]
MAGNFSIHRTSVQNLVISVVLLLTVGIYLAVLGLGAGGGKPSSQRVSDISNAVLYALFFVSGMLGGTVMNIIGPRLTAVIGAFGYPFYVAGFFYYDRTGHEWFPILGGAVLGVSAGLLWTVAGFIQFSYATEKEKGSFIGTQYALYQVGSTIGSLVAFLIIYNGTSTAQGSPTAVYIAFICVMSLSLIVSVFLVQPETVRRADGTAIADFKHLSAKDELFAAFSALKDYRVLLILEAIFCCEFPISIIPAINATHFNARTRALNSLCFYLISPPLCILISKLLDWDKYERRVRGYVGICICYTLLIASWVGLFVFLSNDRWMASSNPDGIDWTDAGYGGPLVLFMCFGGVYTIHQFFVMWIMSLFTNQPRVLAVYGGLFKGVAAAGLAVAFGLSAGGVSQLHISIIMFILQVVSLPICLLLVWKARSTNYGIEEDVIVPLDANIAIVEAGAEKGSEGVKT